VLLGDHGYHLGEHAWWNKNTVFELCARAPLLVLAPGMKAKGKSCSRLVEFLDLYPTLVELCALPAPAGLQGKSFVALLDNPKNPWKEAAYTQVQRGRLAGYSVRTERWRYNGMRVVRESSCTTKKTTPESITTWRRGRSTALTVPQLKELLQRMRKQAPAIEQIGN
jgi:arylsulfatase A-like enzyme